MKWKIQPQVVVPGKKTEVLWINNAKILAAFIVIFLHVSGEEVLGFNNINTPDWWIGNVFVLFPNGVSPSL